MAVNVSVFDLDNYPNNPKTVTVDLTELVPVGNNGEDSWVLSAVTTATASGGAAIQRLYISNTKFGWAKSSGLHSGPYDVSLTQHHLTIAVDEAIGSGVQIALTWDTIPLGGDTVAKDLQTKLNDTARPGGAKEGNLAYLNSVVEFSNGSFQIISGTASDVYTGANRSSVEVADGVTSTGLAAELGFDITITSQSLAADPVKFTSLASDYTTGLSLTVTTAGIVEEANCVAISDGVNTELRGVESSIGSAITLSSGMANTYDAGSLIQVLGVRDPDDGVNSGYQTIDDIVKFAINSILNQIDFSS